MFRNLFIKCILCGLLTICSTIRVISGTTEIITNSREAPIYTSADFCMRNGAAYYLQKQSGFDYDRFKKLRSLNRSLHKESNIINKSKSLYNFLSVELWIRFLIFLCILIIINVILIINIRKRKKAEKNLQRSEGILRATLNATANGIIVTGIDKKIIDYNRLFLRIWEFPSEIVENKDLVAMFRYALEQVDNPELHNAWAQRCFEHTRPAFDIIHLKDDRVYEVYSEALIIQGELKGRAWSYKNITAHKQIEKQLQRSQERYRRLVEVSPDAIYISIDGRIIFTNRAGKELIRESDNISIMGDSILDFVCDEYSERVKSGLLRKNENNEGFPLMEMKLKRLDNTFVDVEAATTIFTHDEKTAVLSFVRDISERKEAEILKRSIEEKTKQLNEALEYDKLKTEFFANISHELRTPINVILGAQKLFVLLLKDMELGDKQEKLTKYIYMIRQNCYRLMRLVNNLIDITCIDAGFFNISLMNYDIINIVECITLSVAEYVQEKGIELVFDTQIEEKIIACDADKIERIMLNLLSNAIKFTNKDGVITVYIKEEAENIVILVSDSGIGIPEGKLNTVFERFVQIDKSFIRNHEGSGVGLSLVKSLVDLHGGNIALRSEVGKGTTFEIRLPITLVSEEAAVRSAVTFQSLSERIDVEFSDIYFD